MAILGLTASILLGVSTASRQSEPPLHHPEGPHYSDDGDSYCVDGWDEEL